ncbi:MAG: serpin family protein, partial [Proteobacteria bacterium]|nr:serpin family protein [Pseudomonadota bacterium]
DTSGFTMVELPYKGGNLAMLVIAPRTPGGLAGIERQLAAGIPVAWSARLEGRKVKIALPRFQLEADYGLEEELQAMGMALPFSSGADFSAMTDPSAAVGGLFISSVRQKSFIKVNERGTEAAAATVADMLLDAEMTFVPEFRADRPFLFLIRDRVSGCILFMGRVMQPAEA